MAFNPIFKRAFQTIFRKSHISDYDLRNLDVYLAKRILPQIKAYRKQYLERDGLANNAPPGLAQGEIGDERKEWMADIIDEERWLITIDEIIYAMRWCLEVDMLDETPGKKAFFREYYGQYVSPEDDKDKHFEQYGD